MFVFHIQSYQHVILEDHTINCETHISTQYNYAYTIILTISFLSIDGFQWSDSQFFIICETHSKEIMKIHHHSHIKPFFHQDYLNINRQPEWGMVFPSETKQIQITDTILEGDRNNNETDDGSNFHAAQHT